MKRVRVGWLLLSVLVAGGCGVVDTPSSGPVRGERVDAELVVMVDKVHAAPAGAVLDEPAEVLAFPGRFRSDVSSPLASALRDREPDDATAFVGLASSAGCGSYGSAELRREGKDLFLRPLDPQDAPEECAAPYSVVAVFAVPRSLIPDGVTLAGTAPQSAGPGTLRLFEPVSVGRQRPQVQAADLTADAGSFLAALPAETAARVRDVLGGGSSSRVRLLGFVLAGCAEKAAVLVADHETSSVYAVLVDGGGTVCDSAQYFVAVFADDGDATRGLTPTDRRR